MAGGKCDQCGVDEYMPYVCKFCRGRFCAAHRLPENHGCAGLGPYREKMRQEGRVMASDPQVMRPQVSTTARAGMSLDSMWKRLDGKMTYIIMGVTVGVFLIQFFLSQSASGRELHNALFLIQSDWAARPWTVVTSIFAHGSLNHLFVNMLVLLFFGQTTERLIGTKRFTGIYFAAGALGGIAQVVLTQLLFNEQTAGLGASGALQGIMGTLVVLAPRLTVLVFFVIPAPLWALTIFYVLFDLLGVITPGSTVGHIAHLAGLATGLAYGYHLRQKHGPARVQPPPMQRPF